MKNAVQTFAVAAWSVALVAAVGSIFVVDAEFKPTKAMAANAAAKAAAEAPPHWHSIDRNGECFDEYTPASLIEILNASGIDSETKETRDSAGRLVSVGVVQREALGSSTVTFYSSLEGCEAAIAKAKHIPDEYR